MTTPLARLLAERIRTDGPLTVAAWMEQCLAHPEYGYYRRKDPLGASGDFTTAPEISQMFGEMIGLWAAVVWESLGRPDPVLLVELGPGRGTLMADLLRAAQVMPGFSAAARVHLVETSPVLRAAQAKALAAHAPHWHESIDTLPPGPAIIVANEFFDALPIHQYERCGGYWHERMVALNADGEFTFERGASIADELLPELEGARDGAVAETCPAGAAVAQALAARLADAGGVLLAIDYGHGATLPGDTLQAVRNHQYHPPLEDAGEADLTAHVDFAALARAAAGAAAWGPVEQGAWLRRLGLPARAGALCRCNPDRADEVERACRRLMDPEEMGSLFKVLALSDPRLPAPPGFEDHERLGHRA